MILLILTMLVNIFVEEISATLSSQELSHLAHVKLFMGALNVSNSRF